ncbi:MAG: ligase-associated DNA damage response endonuclease PdeM [Pseudomonadota bacterium]
MRIELAGASVVLLPERALYLPDHEALLVADVHVGKVETFQRHGIALPSEAGSTELERLGMLLERYRPRELWVLGDLVHGPEALRAEGMAALAEAHRQVAFKLVNGNHDRHLSQLPASWGFSSYPEGIRLGAFTLRHEPIAGGGGYTLAGHLHPTAVLRGSSDRLRLPCFHFGAELGLLPAFTTFSGGPPVDIQSGATYVIADGEVLAL